MSENRGFDLRGVGTRRTLLAAGWRERHLTEGVASGQIIRIRNGWYALPDASHIDVAAVRAGGRVTGVSLVRALGGWTVDDGILHVAVLPNASRLQVVSSTIRRHWARSLDVPDLDSSRDTVSNSIAILARTESIADAVVAIDSALNLGLLGASEWRRVMQGLSQGRTALSRYVDGRSQSGLESRCRMSIRGRGVRLQTQVHIGGVGTVDILIGERLVVELDGYRFHSDQHAFENDRRRDLELARRGYRVLRLSYRQVMNSWDSSEDVILRLVRAGEHLWRPSSLEHFARPNVA
jgi:very-short-patch-repair endonuclease